MKTRTKQKDPGGNEAVESSHRELPANDVAPPRLLILNRNVTKDATMMTLSHPRSQAPTRYLVCPESGLYELRKIASPSFPSSWLLDVGDSSITNRLGNGLERVAHGDNSSLRGYVSKVPDVFTATALDPLFLLLPALERQCPYHGEKANRQLLCMDDLFEQLFDSSKHFRQLMDTRFVSIVERRLAAVCQVVEVDEKMYRLDHERLFQEVLSKARAMFLRGLPPSMEQKFVTRALEKPAFAETFAVGSQATSTGDQNSQTMDESTSSAQSQIAEFVNTPQTSAATSFSISDENLKSGTPSSIHDLQRIRVAYSFILSNYFNSEWEKYLMSRLDEERSSIDLTPLQEYLAEIARLKEEALAARSIGDFSRKRGLEDDEAAAERAEKRKKLEDEEKRRKATESKGVRELKKVNVVGMKKMSDFFKKVPAKA